MRPETHYVKSGGLYIIYQVWGEGPDVLLLPSWYTCVEAQWDVPAFAQYQSEIGSFARAIMFDQPGSGGREVLVSSTVKDLVAGSGIEFADRSSHVLKGVPGRLRLFAVS